MGTTFIGAGIVHFASPPFFEAIIPDELPAKRELIYATGAVSIAGGVGLLVRPSRALRWLLVTFLAMVFPANMNQAIRNLSFGGQFTPPRWAMLARLPVQGLMVWLVFAATRPRPS